MFVCTVGLREIPGRRRPARQGSWCACTPCGTGWTRGSAPPGRDSLRHLDPVDYPGQPKRGRKNHPHETRARGAPGREVSPQEARAWALARYTSLRAAQTKGRPGLRSLPTAHCCSGTAKSLPSQPRQLTNPARCTTTLRWSGSRTPA